MSSATPALANGASTATPVYAETVAVVWDRVASRPGGLRPDEVAQRHTAAVRADRGNPSVVLGEIVESVVEPLQLLLVVVHVLAHSAG